MTKDREHDPNGAPGATLDGKEDPRAEGSSSEARDTPGEGEEGALGEEDRIPVTPGLKVVMVDDEDRFRSSLARRLRMRGYQVWDVADGEEAIRLCRQKRPDVAIVDLKMPGLSGEQVLKEVKRISPEVQIVMLTGHASLGSAASAGRMEAFAYLEKPCETGELLETIENAAKARKYALAKLEMPELLQRSFWARFWGTNGLRPGVLLIGALILAAFALMPNPDSLMQLVTATKSGDIKKDVLAGYSGYKSMKPGESIPSDYSKASKRYVKEKGQDGKTVKKPVSPEETARAARVSLGILVVAALFWATGALPIGFTAFLVAVLLMIFNVFPPDIVAKSYAKDSVIFVMGVLALAAGIGRTGLDRRIGLLLLGRSHSFGSYLFLFLPLLAVTAAFLSEHALVAFLGPLLLVVYLAGLRSAGLTRDRPLIVALLLGLTFAANLGGPGSPAAGGRNAVMIGILSDYGAPPTFAQWVMYGLPFVPVAVLGVALYLYLTFRRKIQVKNLDVAALVRKEADKLGKMTRPEYIAAAVLIVVIALWITASDWLGMGGPALLGLVAMAGFGLISWRNINGISWDVVALYACASGIGGALASTGAATWVAGLFVNAMPDVLSSGAGLALSSSLISGVITNFMSDGATVAAVGPVTVPMATIAGTNPWMVGLATAFASSFAHCFIIGTPNNAMVYAIARDPETGEQLVTNGDFLRHGAVVLLISFAVLWFWIILGYWQWIGF